MADDFFGRIFAPSTPWVKVVTRGAVTQKENRSDALVRIVCRKMLYTSQNCFVSFDAKGYCWRISL